MMKKFLFTAIGIVTIFAIIVATLVTLSLDTTEGTTTEVAETTEMTAVTTAPATPSATYGDYLGMARVKLPGATPEEIVSMAKQIAVEAGESPEFIRTFWGTEPETETETETKPETETEAEPTTLVVRDDMPLFDHAETWALRHLEAKVFFVKDPGPETAWGRAFAAAKTKIATTAALRADAVILAHCIRGEAGIVGSRTRAIAVAELVLNQIDYNEHEFAAITSVKAAVLDRPANFSGYKLSINSPVPLEQVYIDLAIEVMARREMERQGWEWSGRVLPAEYVFQMADTAEKENYFQTYDNYHDLEKSWTWDEPTPYRS